MDEDYIANVQVADVGKDGPSSSPQQNISGENTLTSSPKKSAVPTASSHVTSSGTVDVAAMPNAAPESLKKFTTNKALIEAVNNLFLETYESYTGKVRMTGSGDAKRLVIHFHTAEARDICVGSTHSEFPDLIFHAHDPRQL
ncbi:hypothetical protein RhiirC2_788757 [Rhizophagus irregularis]|uniref:Uncharacterized protein n=1 Tax=Rhizophagus irregularis TaxID=588596 RepID=A0A2N1MPG3_9GLOM|nr:hypothetical protein RhiirC2_788757 [Rhizophagus irregularis]